MAWRMVLVAGPTEEVDQVHALNGPGEDWRHQVGVSGVDSTKEAGLTAVY